MPAPPPHDNFAVPPQVRERDDFAHAKVEGHAYVAPNAYEDIPVPRNTSVGAAVAAAATVLGFALVWYIWWLTIAAALALVGACIARSFVRETSRTIPAAEVAAAHRAWLEAVRTAPAVTRARETTRDNLGHATLEHRDVMAVRP